MKLKFSIFLLSLVLTAAACQKKTAAPVVSRETQTQIFRSTAQEDLKPTRWDQGSTTITNEDRLDLYHARIENIGGAYIGVGSIQNFQLAAWAKSEYVFVMDFTRIVAAANKVHIAFLKKAATPEEFRAMWKKENKATSEAWLREVYASETNLDFIVESMNTARGFLQKRFSIEDVVTKQHGYTTWLYDQAQYDYLRTLAREDRIISLRGDLNGTITFKSIGETLKKMNVPARILYLSNAEEYLRVYSPEFRANVTGLPMDEKSLIVRTVSVQRNRFPWAPGSFTDEDDDFHYNIQFLDDFQKSLSTDSNSSVLKNMERANVHRESGFSEIPRVVETTP